MSTGAKSMERHFPKKAERDLIFRVTAYTGLDLWYYLLPHASQARRVARRAYPTASRVLVELPSGATFRVVDGKAEQAPNSGLPF